MLKQSGDLDRVFQALVDPTRRQIVERLVQRPTSVTELARPLPMSLPAVMQHLGVLEACGLVRSQKVGRVRTCHLVPDQLRAAESWLVAQRTAWEHHLDRLGDVLGEVPGELPGAETDPEIDPTTDPETDVASDPDTTNPKGRTT